MKSKRTIALNILGLMGFSIFTASTSIATPAPQLAPGVLAEASTVVGFAPPEYQGTFRFQLLKDGTLQKVDNKNRVVPVAKLSPAVTQKMKISIDAARSGELIKPEGQRCMDAPLQEIQIRQSSGKTLIIRKMVDCLDFVPADNTALNISNIIKNLEGSFSLIDSLD